LSTYAGPSLLAAGGILDALIAGTRMLSETRGLAAATLLCLAL